MRHTWMIALALCACSTNHEAGSGDTESSNGGHQGQDASSVSSSSVASNGGGGAGGGQIPPPPVHGDCAGLAAVDVFEDITPPGFDPSLGTKQGIVQVRAHPLVSGTLFVGTDAQGLFESTDCGATWTKIDTGKNSAVIDSGILWNFTIDPIEPDVMYLGSLYASCSGNGCPNPVGLFKSVDGGVNFDPIFSDEINQVSAGALQAIGMDPTDHRHIVVSFHHDCAAPYASNCEAETTDGGQTWRVFNGPPQVSGWLEGAQPYVLGPKTWLILTPQNGVYYTNDGGAHFTTTPAAGINAIYETADGVLHAVSDYGMWRATDPSTWEKVDGPKGNPILGDGQRVFIGVRFPWQADPDKHYFVAAEPDGSSWSQLPSPAIPTVQGLGGPANFAYDAHHHVLYSANATAGLLRIVTR